MQKENKLREILEYYKEHHYVNEDIDDIFNELIRHNVEVQGDSFYCDYMDDELKIRIMAAGTKESADIWMLKKFITLVKTGEPFITVINGNHTKLLELFNKYPLTVFNEIDGVLYIGFNIRR